MTGSVPSEELRAGFQLGDLKPACRGILTALGEGIFRTSKTVGSGGDSWGSWKEGIVLREGKESFQADLCPGSWEWARGRVAVSARGGPSGQPARQAGCVGWGSSAFSSWEDLETQKNEASRRALPHLYCGN